MMTRVNIILGDESGRRGKKSLSEDSENQFHYEERI